MGGHVVRGTSCRSNACANSWLKRSSGWRNK